MLLNKDITYFHFKKRVLVAFTSTKNNEGLICEYTSIFNKVLFQRYFPLLERLHRTKANKLIRVLISLGQKMNDNRLVEWKGEYELALVVLIVKLQFVISYLSEDYVLVAI